MGSKGLRGPEGKHYEVGISWGIFLTNLAGITGQLRIWIQKVEQEGGKSSSSKW